MSKKKTPSFATHINAMSTPALVWEVVQILVFWGGLLYFTFTGNTTWQILCGVLYITTAIAAVGRELAYRDDRKNRPIFGDVHISKADAA